MQQFELDVPEELQHSIRGFWYREAEFGAATSGFEVLPDGHAEVIFHFGSGCSLMIAGQLQALPSPFIVGLLQQPVYFYGIGRLPIIGIKCLPWAVYEMLELPAVKGGVQRLTHPLAGLQHQLQELVSGGCTEDALKLIRDWLLERRKVLSPEVIKAGQAILNTHGSLTVSSVADAAHATVRTLERKFKASSGHTIKDVAGLIRFEQARDRLWEKPDTAIAGLAYDLGYADQSHLNREFKRYSGMTAAAFARRKKELGDDFVAIVLSS